MSETLSTFLGPGRPCRSLIHLPRLPVHLPPKSFWVQNHSDYSEINLGVKNHNIDVEVSVESRELLTADSAGSEGVIVKAGKDGSTWLAWLG